MEAELKKPTSAEVKRICKKWANCKVETQAFNDAIMLFKTPNNDLEEVTKKLKFLNGKYRTHVYYSTSVAKEIAASDFDSLLTTDKNAAFTALMQAFTRGNGRKNYCAVTKYCFFTRPDMFYIYDSQAAIALKSIRNKFKEIFFKNDDLLDYQKYTVVIDNFKKQYKLENCTNVELDHYLWALGKSIAEGKK